MKKAILDINKIFKVSLKVDNLFLKLGWSKQLML